MSEDQNYKSEKAEGEVNCLSCGFRLPLHWDDCLGRFYKPEPTADGELDYGTTVCGECKKIVPVREWGTHECLHNKAAEPTASEVSVKCDRCGGVFYSANAIRAHLCESPSTDICQRCHMLIHGAMIGCGDGTGNKFMHTDCWSEKETDHSVSPEKLMFFDDVKPPELQLLVIDAGECCFVKVEAGRLDTKILDNDIGGLGFRIVQASFDQVREAIEAKPVPRIERADPMVENGALLVYHDVEAEGPTFLAPDVFEALYQLAGKELPIWKCGEWVQMYPYDCNDHEALWGVPPEILGRLPFKVWRYKR